MLSLDAAWRTRPETVRAEAWARTDAPVNGHAGMMGMRNAARNPRVTRMGGTTGPF